jgi:hypothetical protein
MSDRSKTEELAGRMVGFRLQEEFRRTHGRFPSCRGIPFSDCGLASQIVPASNFDRHAYDR